MCPSRKNFGILCTAFSINGFVTRNLPLSRAKIDEATFYQQEITAKTQTYSTSI
jgi:hypothetical protein